MISTSTNDHRVHGFATSRAPHAIEVYRHRRTFGSRLRWFAAGVVCGYLGMVVALRWPL